MEDKCGCNMHQWKHADYCGCGMHGHEQRYGRRFLTNAEKTEELQNYAEELRKELKAVEEKIKETQT